MKYFEGMLPPCLVCAELGKTSPEDHRLRRPSFPQASAGLEMRFAFFQATSRVHHVPAAMPAISTVSAANPNPRAITPSPNHPFEKSQDVARNSVPRTQQHEYAHTATASAEEACRS